MAWEEKTKKVKIVLDFRVFVLSPIPKNENSEITEILQKAITRKYEQVALKTVKMLFKRHQTQNDLPTLLIM